MVGSVSGRDGAPLVGVVLSLRDEAQAVIDSAESDAEGRYELSALPGQYDLYADWVGPVAHDITLTAWRHRHHRSYRF